MPSVFCNGHASILISLPEDRCTRVRDVLEVLSLLEDFYNHLYAWCLFVHEAASAPVAPVPMDGRADPEACSLTGLMDGIPEEDRLCVAQMEVHPPPFVEISGGRKVLLAMRDCIASMAGSESKTGRGLRSEIDLLTGFNFSPSQIQEALWKHVVAPLGRLEKLRGIRLYEERDPFAAEGRGAALR